ncbi:MAG: hypothetical protein U5Q44_11260 [Dehalococcoidia bacterium]|nr:hypothetical protein [Dehalococcoidia bacterium]
MSLDQGGGFVALDIDAEARGHAAQVGGAAFDDESLEAPGVVGRGFERGVAAEAAAHDEPRTVEAIGVERLVECADDGAGVTDQRRHRGGAGALAVAAELGDEEGGADLGVERLDAIVVARDLAVAVEVEEGCVRSAGAVPAGVDGDARFDLDGDVAPACGRG